MSTKVLFPGWKIGGHLKINIKIRVGVKWIINR